MNKDYEIFRGDTFLKNINIIFNNQIIPFVSGDIVYFSLKNNINENEYIIHKVISSFNNGIATIYLSHEETNNLIVKDYVYDIQAKYGDAIATQFGNFKVKGDVTRD